MIAIIQFFAENETGIYLALGFAALFVVRWLVRSWKEWRSSVFGLERELSLKRLSSAITAFVLILGLALAQFTLATFIAPVLPAHLWLPAPSVDLPGANAGTIDPGSESGFSIEMPASLGCVPGLSIITSPKNGDEVSGAVEILGTADIPNFGFYKYEFAQQSAQQWATIQAGREVIENGLLGMWDTSEITPGDYLLRLIVTDSAGNSMDPCVVAVRVSGE